MMSYIPSRHFTHTPPDGLQYPAGSAQQPGEQPYSNPDASGSVTSLATLQQYQQSAQYVHDSSVPQWTATPSAIYPARPASHPSYTSTPPPIPVAQAAAAHPHALARPAPRISLLEVYQCFPNYGAPGTQVVVRFTLRPSEYPNQNREVHIFFGDVPANGRQIVQIPNGFESRVYVPNLGAITANVKLRAQLSSDGVIEDVHEFGDFQYTGAPSPIPSASTGERRRREEYDLNDRNVRRIPRLPSVPQFHPPAASRTPSSSDVNAAHQTQYRNIPTTISPSSSIGAFESHSSLGGSPVPRMQQTAVVQGATLWPSGSMGAGGPSQPVALVSPSALSSHQVALMRTTQIPGSNQLAPAQSLGKVSLELQGRLSNMALGWSQEEVMASRRLVQFSRMLDGSILRVQFRPIAPTDYVNGTVVVSCIYRREGPPDERDKCYITSVDAIQLLEAIIATPFSVEEKNRIRRNLEGFKPITVSKHKPDQEAFFKLIMEFPSPKPRNIEKDVKVFRWEHLEQALHKIVDKYSVMTADAAEGFVAFRDESESPPEESQESVVQSSSDVQSSQPSVPVFKTEPVESTLSDYQPYRETYSTTPLGVKVEDGGASSQSTTNVPSTTYAPPDVPYYDLQQQDDHLLAALSYNPESNPHGTTDITNDDVSWGEYIAEPPGSAGTQMAPGGSGHSSSNSGGGPETSPDASQQRSGPVYPSAGTPSHAPSANTSPLHPEQWHSNSGSPQKVGTPSKISTPVEGTAPAYFTPPQSSHPSNEQ